MAFTLCLCACARHGAPRFVLSLKTKITKNNLDFLVPNLPTPLQRLTDEVTRQAEVRLYIKRDDLIHPLVSGNKWRKLKYVLQDAQLRGFTTLLTFGGAWSNHLYATAAAGNALGLETIGVVRGEEYQERLTPTLQFCAAQGMKLDFVSRTEYRQKDDPEFLEKLYTRFTNPYLIPEGGSTALALPGVGELVTEVEAQLGRKPDYYALAAGTGGTAAGLVAASAPTLAFSALKNGGFLKEEILDLAQKKNASENLRLYTDYHFGGYARTEPELLRFTHEFEQSHGILLEHVYTAKMLYGLYDLIKRDHFPKGTTIAAIHTGGLQGRVGMMSDE